MTDRDGYGGKEKGKTTSHLLAAEVLFSFQYRVESSRLNIIHFERFPKGLAGKNLNFMNNDENHKITILMGYDVHKTDSIIKSLRNKQIYY